MTDIAKLNDQILQSEALQIHYFLGELNTNHYVVFENFRELRRFLEQTESPDAFVHLWSAGKKAQLEQAMSEVTRLLLNFITSASARTSSSRRMIRRRYKGHPFLDLYQRVVDIRIKSKPVVGFVEDLRNYSLHYALPFAGAHWRYEQDQDTQVSSSKQYFALDKNNLLSGNFGWSEKSAPFLQETDNEIIIRDFATEYFVLVHNFQSWLEKEIHDQHQEELEWLYSASAEINAAMKPLWESLDSSS